MFENIIDRISKMAMRPLTPKHIKYKKLISPTPSPFKQSISFVTPRPTPLMIPNMTNLIHD